jgi:serine protease Do
MNPTPELALVFNLPRDSKGALVANIGPGSAAEKAGFKKGDLITEFNGMQISSVSDLPRMVSALSPGTEVEVKIIREGKMKRVKVILGKLPSAILYFQKGIDYLNIKDPAEAVRWFRKAAEHGN